MGPYFAVNFLREWCGSAPTKWCRFPIKGSFHGLGGNLLFWLREFDFFHSLTKRKVKDMKSKKVVKLKGRCWISIKWGASFSSLSFPTCFCLKSPMYSSKEISLPIKLYFIGMRSCHWHQFLLFDLDFLSDSHFFYVISESDWCKHMEFFLYIYSSNICIVVIGDHMGLFKSDLINLIQIFNFWWNVLVIGSIILNYV